MTALLTPGVVIACAALLGCAATPATPPVQPAKPVYDLRLPVAEGRVLDSRGALEVHVSKWSLYVSHEKLFDLPSVVEMEQAGAGARHKRAGPNDLYVVPVGAVIARSTVKPSAVALYVDSDIPYRLLIDVLFTLGQHGVSRFMLITRPGAPDSAQQLRGFDFVKPTLGDVPAFMLGLQPTGIRIEVFGNPVAEACSGSRSRVAVPKKAGNHDFAALTRCLGILRPSVERAANDRGQPPNRAGLTATKATSYLELIGALQALHDAGIDAEFLKVPRESD